MSIRLFLNVLICLTMLSNSIHYLELYQEIYGNGQRQQLHRRKLTYRAHINWKKAEKSLCPFVTDNGSVTE